MKNYSEEEIQKLNAEYYKLVDEYQNFSWTDFAKKINSLLHSDKIMFQSMMLQEILNLYSGYWFYNDKLSALDKELRQIIFDTVKTFTKNNFIWWSVYYFFADDRKNLEKTLEKYFENINFEENPVDENEFAFRFLDVFKNAYPKFWEKMSARFKKVKNTQAENLCTLFENFYYKCTTEDEKENLLVNYIQENPETILAKEFLGFVYENKKFWNNSIQIFEQVVEKSIFYSYSDIYFHLAWCYGKAKNYIEEEKNYRKCLEFAPEDGLALNNLGYLLYKQRRLDEAEKLILKCLDEELETEFAPNNLVRIYLARGQIEEAREFIASKKFKISKFLVDKVKNYSPKNISVDENSSDDEGIAENKKFYRGETKVEQFTSEKILEDELVMRLESGKEIFGLNLKIYRGDFYGRQYPFYDGKHHRRLDILCEDENGNFYIIELKKDSGYGDAYQQIKNYVDYFKKHRAKKDKKVFGILCLNSPTEKLLQDVRKDNRIRLFEYKISYDELI